jgi:hypothetical protein
MKDCCIFGKSTKNSRIESWWRQLRIGQAQFWIVSFPSYSNTYKLI